MDRPDTLSAQPFGAENLHQPITGAPFYRLMPADGYTHPPLYQVIPVSHGFFHIREAGTGQIKGFRCTHIEACALAKHLEQSQP